MYNNIVTWNHVRRWIRTRQVNQCFGTWRTCLWGKNRQHPQKSHGLCEIFIVVPDSNFHIWRLGHLFYLAYWCACTKIYLLIVTTPFGLICKRQGFVLNLKFYVKQKYVKKFKYLIIKFTKIAKHHNHNEHTNYKSIKKKNNRILIVGQIKLWWSIYRITIIKHVCLYKFFFV